MPSVQVTWGSLVKLAEEIFQPMETTGTGGQATGTSGQVSTPDKTTRILFPVGFSGFLVRAPDQVLAGTEYPVGMKLLAGHAFLHAWYVAAFLAIDKNDLERVALLMDCALTSTVTFFSASDKKVLALESIKLSENLRAAAQVAVDNFLTFAEKVERIADGKQAGTT